MPTLSLRRRAPILLALAAGGGLFVLAGCNDGGPDDSVLAGLVEPLTPPTPSEAARDAFNVYDADARRRSVALLSAAPFGGEPPYVRTYRLLANDADATVRAAAAKALGLHGEVGDASLLVGLLKDETPYVRWEAAQALQRIHNPAAVQPLMDAARADADADVRQAAAQALGQYPTRAVFDTLVGALTDTNYGVVQAAASSLRTLTGHAGGNDPRAWLVWAEANRDRLFANQQTYTYQPYQKPPGLLDKAIFWSDSDPPRPQKPTGLDAG